MSNEDGRNPEIHWGNLKMLKFKLPITMSTLKYQEIKALARIQMTLNLSKILSCHPN